ncbi:hypothetical protein ACK1QP_000602 [Salmonella enterica]|nr:hypothetical protein [Salmonella enterica subsp. enterica]EDU8874934.1 hypothetical protein [Salmonella enterica subsp. enterica]
MTTQILRKTRDWLMPLLLAGVVVCAQAGGTKSVDMTLHLVVTQPPPCTVQDVNATFSPAAPYGESPSSLPSLTVNIPVTCDSDIRSDYRYMKLQLQGVATTIGGEQLLQTSQVDLGIRFCSSDDCYENGDKVPINTGWFYMSTSELNSSLQGYFKVVAQVVKRFPDEILGMQEYQASATMILDYE